jgi:hypothetical protein
MDHSEQPSLARVLDIQVWGKPTGGRNRGVGRVSNLRIDIVWLPFEVEEILQETGGGGVLERPQIILACAEAGPSQEVLDAGFASCHEIASKDPRVARVIRADPAEVLTVPSSVAA